MRNRYLIAAIVVWTAGCSTVPPAGPPANTNVPEKEIAAESSIDIQYVLGRNHRRLWIRSDHGQIRVQSSIDRQIVEEKAIDSSRYQGYFKQASDFVQTPRKPAGDLLHCRAPFKVQIQLGHDVKAQSGCRTSDEGALSHLVRDGEMLLISS